EHALVAQRAELGELLDARVHAGRRGGGRRGGGRRRGQGRVLRRRCVLRGRRVLRLLLGLLLGPAARLAAGDAVGHGGRGPGDDGGARDTAEQSWHEVLLREDRTGAPGPAVPGARRAPGRASDPTAGGRPPHGGRAPAPRGVRGRRPRPHPERVMSPPGGHRCRLPQPRRRAGAPPARPAASGTRYSTCTAATVPPSANGMRSAYARDTAPPYARPTSRQSFAENSSGALTGTVPEPTSAPSTRSTTDSGPAGRGSTYVVTTSTVCSPAASGAPGRTTVRWTRKRLYSYVRTPSSRKHVRPPPAPPSL